MDRCYCCFTHVLKKVEADYSFPFIRFIRFIRFISGSATLLLQLSLHAQHCCTYAGTVRILKSNDDTCTRRGTGTAVPCGGVQYSSRTTGLLRALASAGQQPNGTVQKCLPGRYTAAWRRTETRHPKGHCMCSTEPLCFSSVMCDACASTGCCVCGLGRHKPPGDTSAVASDRIRNILFFF